MMAASPSFDGTLEWVARERPMPPDLPDIACPFTVAWGTRDAILPPRQGPRWERLVPGARLIPLRGLGHVPMADDPELVARGDPGDHRAGRDPAGSRSPSGLTQP